MAHRKQWTNADKAQWQAQTEERTAALLEQLEAGVQAIQTGDDFKHYLQTAAKFHSYSANNVLLVLAQRPDATRVAGYKTWQALGRQVRKGERAIYIFAPRPYLVREKDEAGDEEARQVLAFRSVAVWDISQTDGQPLPAMDAPALTGDVGEYTYRELVIFAAHEGVTVTNHDPNTDGDDSRSTYHGYYSPGRKLIFVKRAAPAQMVKTLIHELGHHLDPELRMAPPAERETVAEATAFVAAAPEGLDTSSYSFPYIAFWAGQQNGPALITSVISRVQVTARQIIAGIEDCEEV